MASRSDRPDVRTPLLPDSQGLPMPVGPQKRDHPIFLRVCHSPWKGIGQRALVYIRGLIITYLTALFGVLIVFKVNQDDENTNWGLFDFSTVMFVLLFIYHITAFSWTFTHLYFPDINVDDRRLKSVLLRFMSLPIQRAYIRKRFQFSVFYTIVHVFAVMNALVFWTILVPQGHGHLPPTTSFQDFFSDGWFTPFCIINLWGVTSLLAVTEVFLLNSISRQVPVAGHVFAVIYALTSYLGYAAFGWMLTGHWAYFWMDPELVGNRASVAAHCGGFVGLGPTVFLSLYGLIGVREKVTRRDENGESPFNPSGFIYTVAHAAQQEFERHVYPRGHIQRVDPGAQSSLLDT